MCPRQASRFQGGLVSDASGILLARSWMWVVYRCQSMSLTVARLGIEIYKDCASHFDWQSEPGQSEKKEHDNTTTRKKTGHADNCMKLYGGRRGYHRNNHNNHRDRQTTNKRRADVAGTLIAVVLSNTYTDRRRLVCGRCSAARRRRSIERGVRNRETERGADHQLDTTTGILREG